jgi:hypothetical protein
MGGLAGETTEHQPAHGQVDHRFTALREVFIIFTEPAIPANPGDGAFDDLPARQDGEGRHRWGLDIYGIPAPAPRAFYEVLLQKLVFEAFVEKRASRFQRVIAVKNRTF